MISRFLFEVILSCLLEEPYSSTILLCLEALILFWEGWSVLSYFINVGHVRGGYYYVSRCFFSCFVLFSFLEEVPWSSCPQSGAMMPIFSRVGLCVLYSTKWIAASYAPWGRSCFCVARRILARPMSPHDILIFALKVPLSSLCPTRFFLVTQPLAFI